MGWHVSKTTARTKRVSLGEILDAIEQNGLPQAHGTFWRFAKREDGKKYPIGSTNYVPMDVEAACAIGQGALNLGCDYNHLVTVLAQVRMSKGRRLDTGIIRGNDTNKWSLQRIARFYRGVLRDRLNETYHINSSIQVDKD